MGRRRKKLVEGARAGTAHMRIATPDAVAQYRARRLGGRVIADIGAGIGGQALAFAARAKSVFAVEKDVAAADVLSKNIAARGVSNVTVVVGDALSPAVQKKLAQCDVFFCDPLRPLGEQVRSLNSIEPQPSALAKRYAPLAMELPPQLSPEKIPFDAEKEYLSVNGRLNRLTIYFSPLRRADISVVSLPGEARLTSDMPASPLRASAARSYLYEVDTAVVKAGLLGQLVHSLGADVFLLENGKYALLTSSSSHASAFVRRHRVARTLLSESKAIALALRQLGAARVVLHARLPPQDHRRMQLSLQKGLGGDKIVHVFIREQDALLTIAEQ